LAPAVAGVGRDRAATVANFLTDMPVDVKQDMLKWRKMVFIRSRRPVCGEEFLQLFNIVCKLANFLTKILIFIPPVGPPIKNIIDTIVALPLVSDVLAFIKWIILSSIVMSPAVFQIIGMDAKGTLVSTLYVFEMSSWFNRLFNNPQKRGKKLIAKTADGRTVFTFAV
jgi:hypothetical protein